MAVTTAMVTATSTGAMTVATTTMTTIMAVTAKAVATGTDKNQLKSSAEKMTLAAMAMMVRKGGWDNDGNGNKNQLKASAKK